MVNAELGQGLFVVSEKPEGFERETDYRLAAFLSWSDQLKGKRIAIYGAGANARHILENMGEGFEVVAVADKVSIGATVCGREVVDVATAFDQGVDALVVAAEFRSCINVQRRIKALCANHQVQVFDMYGNDLGDIERRFADVLEASFADQLAAIGSCEALAVNACLFEAPAPGISMRERMRENADAVNLIVRVMEYLLASGKTVAIYSADPLKTRSALEAELEVACVPEGCMLLLASELGLYPENGLYRVLYGMTSGKRVVHVGSEPFNDVFIPLSYGMESVLLGDLRSVSSFFGPYKPEYEAAGENPWYIGDGQRDCGKPERDLRSCVAQTIPDIEAYCGESAARVVSVVGPLVIGFVSWLASSLVNHPREFAEILFAARDGYLVKQVYDVCCEHRTSDGLPRSRYFYTSRKASLAAAENENGERENALKYLAACGLKMGKSYAFVEFVGAGTCQRQLEAYVPFSLKGFYFGSRIGNFLARLVDAEFYFDEDDASFLSRYLVLEPFVSSTEPSLCGYDRKGNPVFAEEHRTQEERAFLSKVHEGVMMMARAYYSQWYEAGSVIDHTFVNGIMTDLDSCDHDEMMLYDDLNDRLISKEIEELSSVRPKRCPEEGSFGGDALAAGNCGRETDGGSARDHLLALLKAFDYVCGEFGLTYVATHGTLLGAMRESGFVANDNDLDVAMPRGDYERLLDLAARGVFPFPLAVVTPENDASQFFGGYARLVYLAGNDAESSSSADYAEWMDIMPLDNCPVDDGEVERMQRVIRSLQRTLYAQTYGLNMSKLWDVNPRKLSLYFMLADHASRDFLCRQLKRACTWVEPTGVLTIFAGNYRRARNRIRFTVDDVENAERVAFEDCLIPVPRNAEAWLADHYGPDWMEDPSANGQD